MANSLRLGLHPPGNALHLGYVGVTDVEATLSARTASARVSGALRRGVLPALAARTAAPRMQADVHVGSQVFLTGQARTSPPVVAGAALIRAPVTWRIAARTHAPTVEGRVSCRQQIACAMQARTVCRAVMRTEYDINIPFGGGGGQALISFRDAGVGRRGAVLRHMGAHQIALSGRLDWRAGGKLAGPGMLAWRTSEWASAGCQAAWAPGAWTAGPAAPRWRGAPFGWSGGYGLWREGVKVDRQVCDVFWRGMPLPTAAPDIGWVDAAPQRARMAEAFRGGLRLPHACDENSWRDGLLMPYVRRPIVPWVPPPRPWVPYGNNLHLCRMESGNALHLGYRCQRRIPRRRSYHVQHQIAITRLSDATPIPTQTITISLDADSWAWTWSATLLGADALPLVLPSEQGEPVTLAATIDGHTWHLVVEDWQEDRAFGSRSISVSGRGLSAWLGAPYQPTTSGTMANARTLHQAMEELLPLGEGWTIDWADGTPDWLLPSGAWNWANQAPIQAIHEAAQGVGLVVVPGMAARTLTIQPRYPILPWDFADAEDPDLFHIPDSAILSLSRRQAVPSQANAVYVHGGDAGGIIARAWRTGTSGDRLAATVSDERITHVDGARLLGTRILAGQETQPEVRSITLPLGGVFLLARIGELVALEIGASEIRGLVNSVSITADGRTVRQTITIGEDTPNVWAMWRRLLPEAPVLLGEILAIHEGGTRTVELVGGGRLRVRGDGAVGATVWVRGGRIEGAAPALPVYDVELF